MNNTKPVPSGAETVLSAVGLALIGYGVWEIYSPLVWLFFGVLCLAVAVKNNMDRKGA